MTDGEIAFLQNSLHLDDVMLEWGSGGSTLYFSQCVQRYYSVEHDPLWYNAVQKEIAAMAIKNVHLHLVPVIADKPIPEKYADYIAAGAALNINPTVVLIDGRCRRRCAIAAWEYIHPKTIVYIHDWKRSYYHCVLTWYKVIDMYDKDQMIVALIKK